MHRHTRPWLPLLLLAMLAPPLPAAERSGVHMPDRIALHGQDLVLNGMGLRKIAIIKVYVAGLYLPARSSEAAAVLRARGPRALRMELVRDVDRKRLTGGFREGIERNGAESAARYRDESERFLALFQDMKKGTVIQLADAAAGGLSVDVAGRTVGTLGDRGFADLVFGIWFGPAPPSAELQKGLLGL